MNGGWKHFHRYFARVSYCKKSEKLYMYMLYAAELDFSDDRNIVDLIVFNAFAALITYKVLHFSSKLMSCLRICNLISTLSLTVIFLFWLH